MVGVKSQMSIIQDLNSTQLLISTITLGTVILCL